MNKIGVLGCGWLGLPLAKSLVDSAYVVHGSTTSPKKLDLLKAAGIKPYLISFSATKIEGDIQGFLSALDVLIINLPPRLRSGPKESFIAKMELLYATLKTSSVSKIIFVSSTAVYGDANGEVTEDSKPHPVTLSGKQLLQSEQLFMNDGGLKASVIRFGGLLGPDRHPVTMLSQRKNLTNGNHPINLIHLDDCIHMITTIIQKEHWNQYFNGVYPLHPSKKEYYEQEALKKGIPTPSYVPNPEGKSGKIIVSKNFLDKGHSFHTSIVS